MRNSCAAETLPSARLDRRLPPVITVTTARSVDGKPFKRRLAPSKHILSLTYIANSAGPFLRFNLSEKVLRPMEISPLNRRLPITVALFGWHRCLAHPHERRPDTGHIGDCQRRADHRRIKARTPSFLGARAARVSVPCGWQFAPIAAEIYDVTTFSLAPSRANPGNLTRNIFSLPPRDRHSGMVKDKWRTTNRLIFEIS